MTFQPFNKINHLNKLEMIITQKIHGTNAQVTVADGQVICGSRTRFITPEDDNFGFAKFVHDNKEAFIALGDGTYHGEWAGPGINSGEGLTEKTFVMFDFWLLEGKTLPPQCALVPVLCRHTLDTNKINEVMQELKTGGSKLVEGFMKPEGIVITVMNTRFKMVFDAEEVAWKKAKKIKIAQATNYDHFLQPLRLEKLLSKDERYKKNFPESLPGLCNDYFDDMISEGQFAKEELKAVRKAIGGKLFGMIKENI